MPWAIDPEPEDDVARAVLIAAAEQALAGEQESAWWRSGLDDLGWSAPAEQAVREAPVIEP